jgi:hypothetical protein
MKRLYVDRNKLKLILLLIAVALPIGLATLSFYAMQNQPGITTTNNGVLIMPVMDITELFMVDEQGVQVFQSFEELVAGIDAADYLPAPWRLFFLGSSSCDEPCGDRLFYLRQLHRLLGADEDRVARYYVNVGSRSQALDERTRQMFAEAFSSQLLVYSERDALLSRLTSILPEGVDPVAEHYIFLADPLGNVMLYFTPDNTPEEILQDIERLLDRSSLG